MTERCRRDPRGFLKIFSRKNIWVFWFFLKISFFISKIFFVIFGRIFRGKTYGKKKESWFRVPCRSLECRAGTIWRWLWSGRSHDAYCRSGVSSARHWRRSARTPQSKTGYESIRDNRQCPMKNENFRNWLRIPVGSCYEWFWLNERRIQNMEFSKNGKLCRLTCEPNPRVAIMKKKKTAHRGATGILAIASG